MTLTPLKARALINQHGNSMVTGSMKEHMQPADVQLVQEVFDHMSGECCFADALYKVARPVEILISSGNPLDTQLRRLNGSGWNTEDWTNTLGKWNGYIIHKKTGVMVFVHNDQSLDEFMTWKATEAAYYAKG